MTGGDMSEKIAVAWRIIVLYALCVLVLWLLRAYQTNLGPNLPLHWDKVGLGMLIVYTMMSFRTVETRERGIKTFFRREIQNIGSGWTFAPRWVFDLITFSKNVVAMEVGTPQEVGKRNTEGKIVQWENVPLAAGTVRASNEPLRVTFSTPEIATWQLKWDKPEDKDSQGKTRRRFTSTDDPLARRFTADPNVLIRYVIQDPRRFVRTMGDESSARIAIEKVVMVALQEYCSKRTASFVLWNLPDAIDYLQYRLEVLVRDPDIEARAKMRGMSDDEWRAIESWGVDIQGVEIKSLGIPFHANQAMSEARAAGFKKQERVTLAEGTNQELILEGKGKAAAEQALLRARAEGLKAFAEALKTDEAKLAAQLEAMQNALKEGKHNLFLGGGTFHDILRAVADRFPSKLPSS